MANRSKKHHTVPCSYLRWFTLLENIDDYRKSKITQFDKRSWKYRLVDIKNCWVIKNINTLYSPEGLPTDILEKSYWENQDTFISDFINRTIKSGKAPDVELYNKLFSFIASMSHRSEIRIDALKQEIHDWNYDTFFKDRTSQELSNMWIIKKIDWNFEIYNNNYILGVWLHRSKELLKFIWEASHVFFLSSGHQFITSDNPVCILPKTDDSQYKWEEIFFPITKKLWILISKKDAIRKMNWKILPADINMVKCFNDMTSLYSNRYLYWSLEEQFKNIEITKEIWLDNPQFYF